MRERECLPNEPKRSTGTFAKAAAWKSGRLEAGQNVVFDVDVHGGCRIKEFYGDRALSMFIQPPSVEELRRRLESRGTDAPEVIDDRIARAEYELTFAPKFDTIVVNDDLEKAKAEALARLKAFLHP